MLLCQDKCEMTVFINHEHFNQMNFPTAVVPACSRFKFSFVCLVIFFSTIIQYAYFTNNV